MTRMVTLEFYDAPYRFSAGHFTIFSATERERLHGHNYSVSASVRAAIREPGLTFDYTIFKKRLISLCQQVDRYFLLPKHSPYLHIQEEGDYYTVIFNHEKMLFLKCDVLMLPIENTTLEDLAQWFIQEITSDKSFIQAHAISAIDMKVFNGPEQSAGASWEI